MAKRYVDNAQNRRLGRVGKLHGTHVLHQDGSVSLNTTHIPAEPTRTYVDNGQNSGFGRMGQPIGGTHVLHQDRSVFLNTPAQPTRTYVDNAQNRGLGRVGQPIGTHVLHQDGRVSLNTPAQPTRSYVDNAQNRGLGRVGQPIGTHVLHQDGRVSLNTPAQPTRSYVDNAQNRGLGRVGKPIGTHVLHRDGQVTIQPAAHIRPPTASPAGFVGSLFSGGGVTVGYTPHNNLQPTSLSHFEPNQSAVADPHPVPIIGGNGSTPLMGGGTNGYGHVNTVPSPPVGDVYGRANAALTSLDGYGNIPTPPDSSSVFSDITAPIPLAGDVYDNVSTPPDEGTQLLNGIPAALARDGYETVRTPQVSRDGYGEGSNAAVAGRSGDYIDKSRQLHSKSKQGAGELDAGSHRSSKKGDEQIHQRVLSLVGEDGTFSPKDIQLCGEANTPREKGSTTYTASWNNHPTIFKKFNISSSRTRSDRWRAKAKREMKFLCNLSHPSIATIYGAVLDSSTIGVVMDFYPSTLFQAIFIEKHEFLEHLKMIIAKQIIEGIDFLHSNGVALCTLTSSSIRLSNYSCAKIESVTPKSLMIGNTCLKKEHIDECYAAPEIIQDRVVTADQVIQADIFSFATVMYELFENKEAEKGLPARMREYSDNAARHLKVPYAVFSILVQCWDDNPCNRPEAAVVFSHLLVT